MRREVVPQLDRLHDVLLPAGTEAADYLVYRIFDTVTDAWYPVITELERRVDALEAEVFEDVSRDQLARIYRLRHTASTRT